MLFYTIYLDEEQKTKFEQLYYGYHEVMLRKAKKILLDQMEAEDAVHLSFLKLVNNLDKIEIEKTTKTNMYVLTVVEHCCIDIIRKRKKENILSWEELEDWQMPYANDEYFAEESEENRVLCAIEKLPPLYREIIILKYVNDFDNQLLAQMFGIEEASVRKRISRGKMMLAEILNGVDLENENRSDR